MKKMCPVASLATTTTDQLYRISHKTVQDYQGKYHPVDVQLNDLQLRKSY